MRKLAIPLLALALAAGACSGGDEEIAGVGDTVIRLSDVSALYETEALPIDESFRETLFRLMAVEVLTQSLAADYGLAVDPAAVQAKYAQLEADRTLAGLTPAQFLGVADASQEMVHFNAELVALRETAIDALVVDPAVVDDLFADPAALTTVCAKHILVETQEEAEAVIARLEDGEDFAAVAGEVSADTNAEGGDLGCGPAASYVPEFALAAVEAPLGEVYGPVETEFGFHVLVVSERTSPTREDYLADPRAVLSDQKLADIWVAWLNDALQAADAWVAERYGTWTPVGIQPPSSDTTSGG